MTALYDKIGSGYSATRRADSRIVAALVKALCLPRGSTVVDVGAGTGKIARAIADLGYSVLAVEPSIVMRMQAEEHPSVRYFEGVAERMPLADRCSAGAVICLALHHFTDPYRAFLEIQRIVGAGPIVIFAFEPSRLQQFWLAEYFPSLGRERDTWYARLRDVRETVEELSGRKCSSAPFPLPSDLVDRFAAASWRQPEAYLDPVVRAGISSFALMDADQAAAGLARLQDDLRTGRWDAKHGSLREQAFLDLGYVILTAHV